MVTAMCTALFIGMRVDDRKIEDHLVRTTATVISVSPLRTGIEFVDTSGVTIRPATGVLYPGLLSVGQQFVVEYDAEDPTIVRVAGRTAMVGNLVIAATLVGTWVVAGGLVLWLRRPRGTRKPGRRPPGPTQTRAKSTPRRRRADDDVAAQQEATSASISPATSGAETTNPSSGSD